MKKNKEPQPKLKLPQAPADVLLESAGWVSFLALWGLTLYYYRSLPEIIPNHFNTAGQPDGYGSKNMIFFFPLLAVLLNIGLSILNRYPHIFNYPVRITPENALKQYLYAVRMIRFLKFSMNLAFLMIVVAIYQSARDGSGKGFPLLIVGVIGLTSIPVIVYLVAAAVSESGKKR